MRRELKLKQVVQGGLGLENRGLTAQQHYSCTAIAILIAASLHMGWTEARITWTGAAVGSLCPPLCWDWAWGHWAHLTSSPARSIPDTAPPSCLASLSALAAVVMDIEMRMAKQKGWIPPASTGCSDGPSCNALVLAYNGMKSWTCRIQVWLTFSFSWHAAV